jgi:uncharacterized membrane protein
MKMNRLFAVFTLLLALVSSRTFGQMNPTGQAKTDSFPTVTVHIHHRDPVEKPAGYFELTEGDQAVKYKLAASTPNDSGQSKSILILWEYMPIPVRDAQNKYFRQVILRALPGLLQEGDEVNVATFAWTDQAKGTKTLALLKSSFSADTASLGTEVRLSKAPGGKGVNVALGSELYPAISEAIDVLAPSKKVKMLIVLSAEFPNIFNPIDDRSTVTKKANDADVAVYNLRYKQKAPKYNLDDVARNTYGLSAEVDQASTANGVNFMQKFADEAVQRSLGMDYALTFKTETPRDGKTHALQIKGGTETLSLNYEAPSLGLGGWIAANMVLFIVIIVLILGAVIGLIFWLRHRNAQEAQRRVAEQMKLEEVQSAGKETENKLQQQKSQLERIQNEEQERKRKLEQAKRQEEAALEAKTLLTEMYANGRQPRLTTIVNGQTLTMELPSPVTTVGRDKSCDVQIADQTISRTHFQVIYQNGKYTLLDLGSTNGTLLNGARASQAELRHGDQIKAGEAILFFYI